MAIWTPARPEMILNSDMGLHFARQLMASHQIYADEILLLIATSKINRKIFLFLYLLPGFDEKAYS